MIFAKTHHAFYSTAQDVSKGSKFVKRLNNSCFKKDSRLVGH